MSALGRKEQLLQDRQECEAVLSLTGMPAWQILVGRLVDRLETLNDLAGIDDEATLFRHKGRIEEIAALLRLRDETSDVLRSIDDSLKELDDGDV
jgi:hypothetical protein